MLQQLTLKLHANNRFMRGLANHQTRNFNAKYPPASKTLTLSNAGGIPPQCLEIEKRARRISHINLDDFRLLIAESFYLSEREHWSEMNACIAEVCQLTLLNHHFSEESSGDI